jgi:FtsP/CotA-like multicopper oxidase with cupredoxin domain
LYQVTPRSRIPTRAIPLLAALLLLPHRGEGQANACSDSSASGNRPDQNLYCIRLLPTGNAESASGTAALEWDRGPFTIPVNRDGTMRYAVTFDLQGLPGPVNRRGALVAWAAPPTLSPLVRLGVVRNGRVTIGPVALDRFLLLVSNEPDSLARDRRGALVLRGESASNRLRPAEMFQIALGGLQAPGAKMPMEHQHHGAMADSLGWTTVPMQPGFAMLPSEMALRPGEKAWLPAEPAAGRRIARPQQVVVLQDGDTLDLEAGLVRKTIAGRSYTMFGFNGQLPGPLLRVDQGTEVVVRFRNRLPLPSTIHWHGIRLEARFDGVPGLAQPPVAPGDSFTYHLRFPDAGLYWYHPHVREDIQQDLGLYGNIFVPPPASAGWPAAREEFLLLDDLLVTDDGLVPYGRDTPTHAAMGRFGNLFLVNGERDWTLKVQAGELVRLFLTNSANARTFNLGIEPDVTMELRGADLGRYPRPLPVDHIVIGPAERFTVDLRFPRPGRYALVNRIRALDHLLGRLVPVVDTVGWVEVGNREAGSGSQPVPSVAREETGSSAVPDTAMANEVASYLARADSAMRRSLELTVTFTGLPFLSERLMKLDSIFFAPVEWAGTMPMMNWATTGDQAHWTLRDPATGKTNHAIDWRFKRGTLLRLVLTNRRDVLHGMQHPIHLHGQRFLVLAVGGVPNPHPVWKDTVIVPGGGAVELLVDLSNPGPWMLHCHIAEHLDAGMMTTIVVEE